MPCWELNGIGTTKTNKVRHFILTTLIALWAFAGIAQSSWKTDDSEKLAKKFAEKEDYRDDFFIYTNKTVRIEFEHDKDLYYPSAIKGVECDVLSFLDYERFTSSVFQNDQVEISGPYGQYKNSKTYDLPRYKRSYQSSGIFHQDGEQILFRLPSSTFGEVQTYSYSSTTEDVKYFTSLYLSDPYFQLQGKVEISIPDWLELEVLERNFEGHSIKRTEAKEKRNTLITYEYENLNKMVRESGSPGPTYYEPHLLFVFKTFSDKRDDYNLLGSTEDQYEWYKGLVDVISEDDTDLEPIVEELTSNAKTELEKLEAIFYWVQDNVRYIAFEDGIAGFKPESAINVCNNRYGDCKGMANLAKHMLKLAGFDARLTWVGTRRIAYDYSIPSLAVDNHMICTVILDGEEYFIDPTETYISLGDYAHRIQGRQVLIEDGDEYMLKKVPEFNHEHNKTITNRAFTMKGNQLAGKVSEEYNGESKTRILRGYNGLRSDRREQALVEFVNDNDKNLKASNITTSDLKDRSKPVKVQYDYALENHHVDLDNQLLIELDYDQDFYYFTFDDKRKTDYVFDSKMHRERNYTFTIPNGYRVVSLPKGLSLGTDDYQVDVKVSANGNTVNVQRVMVIPNGIITKENQAKWNEDHKTLRAYYDDYLVLEKIK